MDYLQLGRIVKTVGLKGEVKIYPTTHFRSSRFKKGNCVFLKDNDEYIKLIIKSHRANGDVDILSFENHDKIEDVERYIQHDLFVLKDNNFLKKGEYFYSDLEGCKAIFDNEKEIGIVKKIEEYNSYATLRIKTDKKDVLIPFVKAFILNVDIEKKIITIKYMPGLVWK